MHMWAISALCDITIRLICLSVPNKARIKKIKKICLFLSSKHFSCDLDVCVCVLPVRWLVLDTDTRDLVSVHTDGNEIISNVKYSPGKTTLACITAAATVVLDAVTSLFFFVLSDGNFLALASHDNFVYIYAVTENGRKYSRVGRCAVSARL